MKKLFLGTAFLSAVFAFQGCKQQQAQMPQASYKTMKVAAADRTMETAYSATIKGRQDIEVYPQVSGTLKKLCVTEGQVVRKGQTLFIIDQVPYRAALATAVSNVRAAEAALATAKLTSTSKDKLYEQKVISSYEQQTAKNTLLSAEAALAQAKAMEVNARNNLSYTVVKAPSDGVVGVLPYRVGALVSPSMPQALTTVSDNSEMYVYFSVTENQLLDMTEKYGTVDKAIKAMPSVKLKLNNGTVYESEGKIESISGVIDQQTGSVTVRAVFPNKGRILHSGASGSVLMTSSFHNQIVIPQAATMQLQDKVAVYKVENGVAKSTLIKVAPINDGQEFVVTDGLKAGDEIIAEGAGLVREGTKVK